MGDSKEPMNISQKIEFIAHGNASGLYDSGLDFQTAYKMELERVSQWDEDEIESEHTLRNEYFESGGVDGRINRVELCNIKTVNRR